MNGLNWNSLTKRTKAPPYSDSVSAGAGNSLLGPGDSGRNRGNTSYGVIKSRVFLGRPLSDFATLDTSL
jgi:hypothetical protein